MRVVYFEGLELANEFSVRSPISEFGGDTIEELEVLCYEPA